MYQFPDSLGHARAVMLFNTATIFCISRENDKARKALQEVTFSLCLFVCTSGAFSLCLCVCTSGAFSLSLSLCTSGTFSLLSPCRQ